MSLWSELKSLYVRDAAPVRAVMVGVPNAGLIQSVTATTSLGLSSMWRGLDILSNGVSQLPWRELRGNLELPPSRLVTRPQADRTRREWVSLVVSTLALYDVCYLLKIGGEDGEGVASGLLPLDPTQVMAVITDTWSMVPPDEYYVGQSRVSRDQLVILHRSPQPTIGDDFAGVLSLARTTFAAALAAENYASRYWQSGGSPTVALETEQKLNGIEAEEMRGRWSESRGKGPDYPAVLSGGIHAAPFGADPTTESAVEARRELVADVGRYLGIPTRMMNAPTGDSETYTSSETSNMELVRFTLQNYIGAIEDAISDQLPPGRHIAMDTRVLTRSTQLAQAQALQLATGGKAWMMPDEAREEMQLPPSESPDQLNPSIPNVTAVPSVNANSNGVTQ